MPRGYGIGECKRLSEVMHFTQRASENDRANSQTPDQFPGNGSISGVKHGSSLLFRMAQAARGFSVVHGSQVWSRCCSPCVYEDVRILIWGCALDHQPPPEANCRVGLSFP